jgi:hypothetical protein
MRPVIITDRVVRDRELRQWAAIYQVLTDAHRAHWFGRLPVSMHAVIVARAAKSIRFSKPTVGRFYEPKSPSRPGDLELELRKAG